MAASIEGASPSPPFARTHERVRAVSPEREHLLRDLKKFSILINSAHGEGGRVSVSRPGVDARGQSPTLVVSTFGRAPRGSRPRDSVGRAAPDNGSVPHQLHQPTPPVGIAPSIPTAPRWAPDAKAPTAAPNSVHSAPSPASYSPRAIRPHSAHAVIGTSKRGPTVLVKGIVLPASPSPSPSPRIPTTPRGESADNRPRSGESSGGDGHCGARGHRLGIRAEGGPPQTFARARRFDERRAADSPTTSPGPASYSPRLSERHIYSAHISESPRTRPFTIHKNVAIYGREPSNATNDPPVTGPGAYNVPSGGATHGGVTIPKAPRLPPAASSKAVVAGCQGRANHEGEAEEDERVAAKEKEAQRCRGSEALFSESIAARLARQKAHESFFKAPRDQPFKVVHGRHVYASRSAGSTSETPGVGAYTVRDGRTLDEAARAARRIAESRARARSASRAGRSPHHVTTATAPGPADYSPRCAAVARPTFNKFLRESQLRWKHQRHLDTNDV